jgi:hypothetical protein
MTDVLGPVIAKYQVETAALQIIETWLEQSLSHVERAVLGMTTPVIPRPPAPALQLPTEEGTQSGLATSIHGGVDFDTDDFDYMPEIIVVVEPNGEPTRFGSGDYSQDFDMQVGVQVYGQSEDLARMFADLYGAAVRECIVQNGTLGGLATWSRWADGPTDELIDKDDATDAVVIQSTVTFSVSVDSVVNDQAGTASSSGADTLDSPDPSQVPPSTPDAQTVTITVTDDGKSLLAPLPLLAGAPLEPHNGLVPSN